MKKIFILCLAVILLVCIARQIRADVVYNRGGDARVSIEIMGDSDKTDTASVITADNRILGFTCTDSSAGGCGLYDTTSEDNAQAGTGVFGEIYVAAGTSDSEMFPLPRELDNVPIAITTNATGRLMVYYE